MSSSSPVAMQPSVQSTEVVGYSGSVSPRGGPWIPTSLPVKPFATWSGVGYSIGMKTPYRFDERGMPSA